MAKYRASVVNRMAYPAPAFKIFPIETPTTTTWHQGPGNMTVPYPVTHENYDEPRYQIKALRFQRGMCEQYTTGAPQDLGQLGHYTAAVGAPFIHGNQRGFYKLMAPGPNSWYVVAEYCGPRAVPGIYTESALRSVGLLP